MDKWKKHFISLCFRMICVFSCRHFSFDGNALKLQKHNSTKYASLLLLALTAIMTFHKQFILYDDLLLCLDIVPHSSASLPWKQEHIRVIMGSPDYLKISLCFTFMQSYFVPLLNINLPSLDSSLTPKIHLNR